MLIISKPIQMQSIKQPLCLDATFGERICANYFLMNLHVSAQRLLFLLGVGEEESENALGSALVEVQNSVRQQISVEIINNLVNRIVLSQSSNFTYQDSVYISTVLEKMGINNVALLMSEVKKTQEKNILLKEISRFNTQKTKLSHQGINLTNKFTQLENKLNAKPHAHAQAKQAKPYVLHKEIYQRLRTASVYKHVSEWNHDATNYNNVISHNEMLVAEQTRIAAGLMLSSENEKMNSVLINLDLLYRRNIFKENSLKQYNYADVDVHKMNVVVASLFTIIDNIMQAKMMYTSEENKLWFNAVGAVVAIAGENAVPSYEHNEYAPVQVNNKAELDENSNIAEAVHNYTERNKAMYEYLERIRAEKPKEKQAELQAKPKHMQTMKDALNQLEARPLEFLKQAEKQENAKSLQKPIPPELQHLFAGADEQTRTVYEAILQYNENPQAALASGILKPANAEMLNAQISRIKEKQKEMLYSSTEKPVQESILSKQLNIEDEKGETEQKTGPALPQELQHFKAGAEEQSSIEHEAILQYKENKKAALASRILKPANAETLNAQISRIMEKQKEVFYSSTEKLVQESIISKQLNTENKKSETEQKIGPALPQELQHFKAGAEEQSSIEHEAILQYKESQKAALASGILKPANAEMLNAQISRIMEKQKEVFYSSTEKLVQESILSKQLNTENKKSETEQKIDPALPQELQHFKAGAEEQSSIEHEAILQYKESQKAALASGILKPADAETMKAQVSIIEEKQVKMLYHNTEKIVHENVETHEKQLSERIKIIRNAKKSIEKEESNSPKPINIVHRRADRQTFEETNEINFQNRKSTYEDKTVQTAKHETIDKTRIEATSQQMFAKTAEDITEIVNKTLARELNAISDKVYSKMEKRLQSERSRRGW